MTTGDRSCPTDPVFVQVRAVSRTVAHLCGHGRTTRSSGTNCNWNCNCVGVSAAGESPPQTRSAAWLRLG
jgi:hypothetical protein